MNTFRIRMCASSLLALAACTQDASSSGQDLLSTTPKPPEGLMLRSGTVPSSVTFMNSSVAMVNWSDIQPSSSSDADWTTLDDQLSKLQHSGISRVRLRIMSGGDAPAWVKKLGAPSPSAPYFQGTIPTDVVDCKAQGAGVAARNVQGPSACLPFFWSPSYLAAYENLMKLVAAHLDAVDKEPATYAPVSSVVDSACMAIYAEVFYRGQGYGPTNQTLFEAGLNHAADLNCQESAILIHKKVFGTARRTSLAINDWDIVQGTPGPSGDYRTAVWYDGTTTATYDVAEWARKELDFGSGTLLEVQNNGLHTSSSCDGSGPTGSYWCYIAQYPGRHGFQTQSYVPTPLSPSGASLTLLEDLDNGLAMNAEYIELPSGMTSADWSLMACYNDHLRYGNPAPCKH